jgi:hypothetical protein
MVQAGTGAKRTYHVAEVVSRRGRMQPKQAVRVKFLRRKV